MLKYFSERIPATFVYPGIDVERAGLLSGTRGEQIAGRFGMIRTSAFPCGEYWTGLISALEDSLRLHRHHPAALTRLEEYLHRRTGGMIGSLLRALSAAPRSRPFLTAPSRSPAPASTPSVSTSHPRPPPRAAPAAAPGPRPARRRGNHRVLYPAPGPRQPPAPEPAAGLRPQPRRPRRSDPPAAARRSQRQHPHRAHPHPHRAHSGQRGAPAAAVTCGIPGGPQGPAVRHHPR